MEGGNARKEGEEVGRWEETKLTRWPNAREDGNFYYRFLSLSRILLILSLTFSFATPASLCRRDEKAR